MNNATMTNGKAPSKDVVAVIVGALAAMGYSADQIAHIRPIVSYNWKMEGRLRGNRQDYQIYICKLIYKQCIKTQIVGGI